MTVTTSTARVVHNGNGITISFAVPFRFLENGHVAVFLRDAAGGQTLWVENTQYTLVGADEAAGGTLTVVTTPTDYTPAAGEKLVIIRAVPITQETDYVENDPFPAETHERAIDKLTMVNQEQTERLDRTFTIPETDTQAGNFVLPGDVARANLFLGFDALGNPTVLVGTDANTSASAFVANTLLNAADAPAFRAGLDAQEDVISARGDLVVGDATPAPSRLALGPAGTVPTSDGTDIGWARALLHGQCRLAKSGADLLLSRLNGRFLIVDGVAETIPAAGVSLAPAGLAADTTYFIYAFMNAGVMTLEASATGHSADATTGIEIKTGDSTRTLVGMARSIAGPAWVDTDAQRFVLSYFNRREIAGLNHFTTNRSTTSTSYVEIDTEIRVEFLTWADEIVQARFQGSAFGSAVSNLFSSLAFDGTTAEDTYTEAVNSSTGFETPVAAAIAKSGLAEGLHYATGLGWVSTGTGTWTGNATAGRRGTLSVVVRG